MNPYLAWKYKLEVSVTNFSTSEDFLANMTLPYFRGMKADFRDIRAATRYGTKIPYFIETVTEFSQAFIWFKLPKGTDFFYIYYGNGGVTTGSDGKQVFSFFDHFEKLDTSVWKIIAGSVSVSGSILTLQNTSVSSVLESYATYAPNTIVEVKAQYYSGNRTILGYRSYSTQKAAAWQTEAVGNANNQRFAHNGTTGNWDSDGVSRAGSSYNVYGVAHIVSGPLYYANYAYRGTITDYIPGNVSLPIQFYCYYNTGAFKVDWVRIRPYVSTMPTLTLGRKFTTQPKGFPWDNAITGVTTKIKMMPVANVKTFLKQIDTQLSSKTRVMFRRPMFYNPQLKSPYPAWKYKGEINIGTQTSPARVRIPILPGMALDGRDLRITDKSGKDLKFNIFATSSTYLDCWVEITTGTSVINFYYGNGVAKSKSDSSIVGTIQYDTITTVTPNIGGRSTAWKLRGWKYRQEIQLSATSVGGEQILISIPYRPGMTADGRDFRFYDLSGNRLPHYIESVTASSFSVWVKLPASHTKILFYFGNGVAESKSSASEVFNLWDDFDGEALSSEWTVVGGTATVSNSILTLGDANYNSIIRGSTTFGTGTMVEMKMYHPNQNQTICGYWSASNQRACWLGASGPNYNDQTHTYNGSTSTTTDDGVNRGGTTYYVYGITYESGSIGFYVDGSFRRTMTTTTPSGSIPIAFYSTVAKGNLIVDWVRVRTITTITGALGQIKRLADSMYYETVTETVIEIIPEIQIRHNPQWKAPQIYYGFIKTPSAYLKMQPSQPVLKERRELRDYAIVSCDVSRSINDAYMQLSTEFQNLMVPPEGSTVKHYARDSEGTPHLIFHGKILTNSPTHGYYSQTVKMQAADNSINLVTQPVPWLYQVIDTSVDTIPDWLIRILEPEKTGIYPKTLIDTNKEPTQFIFDPKTKKLEAIKEIAKYAGCMYQTKLVTREIDGNIIIRPEFYFVPPERIDEPVNGFDLPAPLVLSTDNCILISDPQVTRESEEKYNSVIVYGVLSENGETVVAQAFSYEVYSGEQKPKTYTIEDNAITEKGSTAEREAIKWLLYFLSDRVEVSVSFLNMFDLDLYQRIRFGNGFSKELQGLTNTKQVQYVAACDPRDPPNSTHLIDVSGVPRPAWLRISSIKYKSEHISETVTVTAITDNIYSVVDPIVQEPYSFYLSPGYYKPVIDDLVNTTQSIVEDKLEKQLTPESCTVLSIDEENKTAVVQTASGKIVTVSLA